MELIVVRHAIAYDQDSRRWPKDERRPLTPRGMKLARKAAEGLKEIVDRPDKLLTSPLVRARQTATILEHLADWPKALETAALAPDGDLEKLLQVLRRHACKSIAVVGHEPRLSELVNLCTLSGQQGLRLALKKPGVVSLTFRGLPAAGRATLNWFLPPRMLRAFS